MGEQRALAPGLEAEPQIELATFSFCVTEILILRTAHSWNGSSEKWGTDGGQKGNNGKLNEKRAYDFTRKPLNLHGPRRIKFQLVIWRDYRIFRV